MLADGPVADLVRATNDVLSEPLRKLGVSQEVPPELTAALEQNSFYFSGFKTHHEMVEASRLMKGEDGTFKPFEQFQRDVQRIDSTYNRSYLQAEYNFAVQSTQMAVKWKEWEKDGDDYDLQYRTAGDDRVREEHAVLDGTTLPPSDPFWNNYLPPLGWNCRCTAVQVRKGKYPQSDSADAIAKGQSCTAKPKQQIFRFNPGKQEKIFPPKHPYYKAPGEVKKALDTSKGSTRKKPTPEEKRIIRSEYEKFVKTLPSVKVGDEISHRKEVSTAGGDSIRVGRKFFSETFAKNERNKLLKETMDIAMDFESWMPKLKRGRIEDGIDHNFQFKAYEISHNGYNIIMKAKLTDGTIAYTMRIKETDSKAEGGS